MKIKKPLVIGGIVVILAILIGVFWFFSQPKTSANVTAQVARGTLTQTVETTGYLESADKVDLSFGTSGSVNVVFVEVGNKVKAGDLLAALDVSRLDAQVQSSWQSVQIARANLIQKQAGSTDQAIAVSEASVASAQVSLDSVEADWENQKDSNNENLSQTYQDLVQVLKDNMLAVHSAFSDADEILGIDNSMANDDFEGVLGANDWQSLNSANNAYRVAKISRDEAETKVLLLSTDAEIIDIEIALDLVKKSFSDIETVLYYTRLTLDGTNVATTTFSSADLSALKTVVDTARTSIQTEETSLLAQEQTISLLEISNETSLTSATNLVSKYAAALVEAEAALEQTKALPRSVDLAPYEASLAQAEVEYSLAQLNLLDAQIYSPIDGEITAADLEVGERVAATTSVITIQSSGRGFQIKADISEADISKVALNNSVEVTFDAFGDDQKFTGKVVKIDPSEKDIDGVIYYQTTVYIDAVPENIDLKPGMTANIKVLTSKKENVLIVPQRAVLERTDGVKYVRVPNGESFDEREVVVGTRGDDGLLEILSGLSEGETIIVSIRS